jgi:hypothetical protein
LDGAKAIWALMTALTLLASASSEGVRVRTVALSSLLVLIACSGAPAALPGADASPGTLASSAPSASAAPDAGSSAASAPTGARPLSARGVKALARDHMQRFNDAIMGNYPGPPNETVDDTFIVIAGDPQAQIAPAVQVTRDTVNALWHGPYFLHRPEQTVIVWVASTIGSRDKLVFNHAPYIKEKGFGVYDASSRAIFFAPGPEGLHHLNHELIHPMLEEDFPHAPIWVLEGLPALFEVVDLSTPGKMRFGAHMRLQTLRTALSSPKTAASVSLENLFALTGESAFRDNEALHYAEAREALRYLASVGQLWPFYIAFRENQLNDPTGVATLQATLHKTLAEATADWVNWIGSPEAEGMTP